MSTQIIKQQLAALDAGAQPVKKPRKRGVKRKRVDQTKVDELRREQGYTQKTLKKTNLKLLKGLGIEAPKPKKGSSLKPTNELIKKVKARIQEEQEQARPPPKKKVKKSD